jgi:hypothetical protein
MRAHAAHFPVAILGLALAAAQLRCEPDDGSAAQDAAAAMDGSASQAPDGASSATDDAATGMGSAPPDASPDATSGPADADTAADADTVADADTAADGAAPTDASLPADAAALADATAPPDASPPDAGSLGDAGPGDGALGGWAHWPMPNAPSSGLPHPMAYDTSAPGIAVDKVTGLAWQRAVAVVHADQSAATPTLIAQATPICAGLTLGGFHDWRVPTRIEMVSLLDLTRSDGAGLDPAVFDPLPAGFFTSTRYDLPYGISPVFDIFEGGEILTEDGYGSGAGGAVAVRCVRGDTPVTGPHYAIAGGTVHDRWTGLTWLQATSDLMLPSAAASYCTQQTTAGGGWREPSINEVETVFGDSATQMTPDPTAFPATTQLDPVELTSSTLLPGATPQAWYTATAGGTRTQSDVVLPIITVGGGTQWPQEFWEHVQCVR